MTLPPERISVKRRRQDEPVDTLILEPGSAQQKKRRFTGFYFQRLHHDTAPLAHTSKQVNLPARDYSNLGIPLVRTSAPGDEVKDFAKYKAARNEEARRSEAPVLEEERTRDSSLLHKDSVTPSLPQQILSARRFHLTRNLSSLSETNPAGGLRRLKDSLRPPLATFIERRDAQAGIESSVYSRPPVDSIVEVKDNTLTSDGTHALDDDAISRKTQINTFVRSPLPASKYGKSIRDDPTTWDHNSDQLANELAALAFDIDPADATEPPMVVPEPAPTTIAANLPHEPDDDHIMMDGGDDFVFETYVRVKNDVDSNHLDSRLNTEVGILIIDDVNEDLWEKYIHSDDDDDEWDEEDEDSNAEDNPRNEYPDDEVSTDDEFGRNVYKYHRSTWDDDEEYHQGRDEW